MVTGTRVVLAATDTGKAGPLGLLVIVLLGIAVYLLARSMVHHLKKVPDSFDPPAAPGDAAQPGAGQKPAEPPKDSPFTADTSGPSG